MNSLLNYAELSKEQVKLLNGLSMKSRELLGDTLLDLVNIRASQLNGCAFCLDMHVKEAKIHGERELRIYHLSVWRESPLFDARERAALEWTETVTKLGAHGVSEEQLNATRAQFSNKEISDLTFAIGTINAWNRLAISFHTVPGSLDTIYGLDKANLAA